MNELGLELIYYEEIIQQLGIGIDIIKKLFE